MLTKSLKAVCIQRKCLEKIVSCAHRTMQAGVLGTAHSPLQSASIPHADRHKSGLWRRAFHSSLIPSFPSGTAETWREERRKKGRRRRSQAGGTTRLEMFNQKQATTAVAETGRSPSAVNHQKEFCFTLYFSKKNSDLRPPVGPLPFCHCSKMTTVNETDIFKAELIKPSTGRDLVLLFSAALKLTLAAGSREG